MDYVFSFSCSKNNNEFLIWWALETWVVINFGDVISHTMGVNGRAGAAYPSEVPGFTPFIVWLVLNYEFVCAPLIVFRILLSHCIVCPSIYGFKFFKCLFFCIYWQEITIHIFCNISCVPWELWASLCILFSSKNVQFNFEGIENHLSV